MPKDPQSPLHVPVLRFGVEYESLDQKQVTDPATGELLAIVSQANAGLIRRDLRKQADAAAKLRELPMEQLIALCKRAAELFLEGHVPLTDEGPEQSPDDYVRLLSRTSGLPHTMCRANMRKIHTVLADMPTILRGLTRGLDLSILDRGTGTHDGVPVSYAPLADSLGVVLPSNSPGVNSIWMPSLALKTPVVLKPGREEPWTPLRIVRAMIAAGFPREAFGFYPTTHEGAAAILEGTGRGQLFGDENTTKAWAHDPRIELHGPGWSKVLLGEDVIDDWERYLDVLVTSVLANGGRSCINASAIFVPRHGAAIARALAQRVGAVKPRPADDTRAQLSAFANPAFAKWIDDKIEEGLAAGGATDVTADLRRGPRHVQLDGADYLCPTIVHCERVDHPLANTEFLFAFASVVEVPQAEMLDAIGHSLVVSAITKDAEFQRALAASPDIDRLNLGPSPTTRVDWDQPHEGNLFETLYRRRAIHEVEGW